MNMNRRTIVACAAMMSALAATALESRQLEVEEGHSETVDLGFAPSGYKQQSGSEFVSVMLAPGASVATVTGVKEGGRSQIEFPDPSGEGVLLTVEVVSDLQKTLIRLRRMLSDFDGLQFSKGSSKILIDGTIGNPTDWAKFNRILKISDFKDKTESIVEFSVDPSTIGVLRKELESQGFELAAPGAKPEKGQLALKYEHNVLTLSGSLWSQKDLARALSILKGHSWLTIVDKPSEDAASSPIVQAVGTVGVDDSLLELGVAFVKVSKDKSRNIGSFTQDANGNLIPVTGLSVRGIWDGFYDFLTGRHSHNGADHLQIKGSLDQTLTALAGAGSTREREYGTIRFHANGDSGKSLLLGGKLVVTPPASGEGEAPKPQEYEYGFKITNNNSRRLGKDTAEADVTIELNGYPQAVMSAVGTSVDQPKRSVSPTVRVPLGQTVIVSGYERMLEAVTDPTGTPFLRNIPILNWFVSGQGEKKEDVAILFLISVRVVDLNTEAPMVQNTTHPDITGKVATPIKDWQENQPKHRGCWTPLNWFRW